VRFQNEFGMTEVLGVIEAVGMTLTLPIAVAFGGRLLGKGCRILPAGGLGVSPRFIKSPAIARHKVPKQSRGGGRVDLQKGDCRTK
jgi:hypothetical protein